MSRTAPRTPGTTADVLYDAFYAGGVGGSIVALYFLAVDLWNGQPLFTPSLMGSVLFLGAEAHAGLHVRLDMAASYTPVHFAAFGLLGTAVAIAVHELELHFKHPLVVGLGIFLLAELAFFTGAAIALPGVVATIGALQIGVANLLAAAGIALFLVSSHRPDLWERFKQALRI